MEFIRENRFLLIGLIFSAFLHISVFGLLNIFEIKKKEIKKEKPIYISVLEKPRKEVKNSLKRKIPKTSHKKHINKNQKKINKVTKKTVNKKKKVIKKNKVLHKKVVKKIKKEKKPEKLKVKNETLQDKISEEKNKNLKNVSEKEKKDFSLLNLKGKNSIFEVGDKIKEEKKKVSEEDIYAYIKALERYLNNLARRKDLYPPMAKRLRLEGSLTVRFTVRKDGSVDENSIKIVIGSGYSILDKGAVKLIKKYVPLFAKQEGKKPPRDKLTIELPVTFEIIDW